jgi:hypothetical protein
MQTHIFVILSVHLFLVKETYTLLARLFRNMPCCYKDLRITWNIFLLCWHIEIGLNTNYTVSSPILLIFVLWSNSNYCWIHYGLHLLQNITSISTRTHLPCCNSKYEPWTRMTHQIFSLSHCVKKLGQTQGSAVKMCCQQSITASQTYQ